jgi:hypothetical protein
VDQYILQFKIPVHNHQADDLLESINDLWKEHLCFTFWEIRFFVQVLF